MKFAEVVQYWLNGEAFSTNGFVGHLVQRNDSSSDVVGVVVGIKNGVIYVQPVASQEHMPMVLAHPARLEYATKDQEARVGRWYAANLSAEKKLETQEWWKS